MKLYPELTQIAGKTGAVATLTTIMACVIVTISFYNTIPVSILISWSVFQLLLTLLRFYTGFELVNLWEENEHWRRVTKRYIIVLTLLGMGWGGMGILIELYGTFTGQLFYLCVLIGLCGGSIGTVAPVFPAYIGFLSGIMGLQFSAFLIGRGQEVVAGSETFEFYMAILIILFSAVAYRGGKTLYLSMLQSEELRRKLVNSSKKSEQANQAKTRFLSSISHELRTPLHSIMGFGQLLEIDMTLADKNRKQVSHILKASDHLLTLINQILELSRIESGQVELNLSEVDLLEVLDECEILMQGMADEKKVKLIINTSEKPCVFKTDELKLKQILLNLISNAIKYNKTDGSVEINLSHPADDKIKVSIVDTGIGISSEKHSEMFQSFNRLGQESKGQEGAGIGLVITKELLHHIGGSISFSSEVNKGSEFIIELNATFFTRSLLEAPELSRKSK